MLLTYRRIDGHIAVESTCSWPSTSSGSSRIGLAGGAVPERQLLWSHVVVVLAAFRVGLRPREG
jgi:hypothetical protein